MSSAVTEHLAFLAGEEDQGVGNCFPLLQVFKENQQMLSQVPLGKRCGLTFSGFIKSSVFPLSVVSKDYIGLLLCFLPA